MRKTVIVWTAVVLLAGALSARAAEDYEEGTLPDYAFSLGVGLVDPEGPVEPYYSAAFRFRLGEHDRQAAAYDRGIQAFLEPEVGYWTGDTQTDTLVGVNLLGLVPFRSVDYYFGVGAGLHFQDVDTVQVNGNVTSESDQHFGMNAQFGLDVHVSDKVALFGTGRFDLVEGSDNQVQDKLIVGLRFLF